VRLVNVPTVTMPRYVADPNCERCKGRGLHWTEETTTGSIRVTVTECACRTRQGAYIYDTRNVIFVLPPEEAK
jgi:hypothetical protein